MRWKGGSPFRPRWFTTSFSPSLRRFQASLDAARVETEESLATIARQQGEAAAAAAAGMGAREWELENVRRPQLLTPSHLRSLMALRLAQAMRHKTGELNTAELGFENMKAAMQDPSVMAETMKLMQDPEAQRKVKEMMADPAFQAQAQQAMQAMQKAGGGAPAG